MYVFLKAAFSTKRHLRGLLFSFFCMLGLTIANQMEIVSLGVILNTGSDFFSLFGDGEAVTKTELDSRWKDIDLSKSGAISQTDAIRYLSAHGSTLSSQRLFSRIKLYLLDSDQKMLRIAGILVFVAIFKGFFLFTSRFTPRVLGIRISKDIRQQYFDHLQNLPMSFYNHYDIGALSTRVVGDANQIALSISSWIHNFIFAPLTFVATLTVCFIFSWQLSCVFLVVAPVVLITIRILTVQIKRVTRCVQLNQERFASVFFDFLAGIQTVKVFGMESYLMKKYEKRNTMMEDLESKMAKYDLMTRPILHSITTFCLVTIIFCGLYLLRIPPVELLVYCGLVYLFYEPIRRFSDENINVQRGVVAAERLLEILRIRPEVADIPDAVELKTFESAIEFKDVSFQYGDEPILRNMSFSLVKGETVAIVGPTGSGKSTILQLLMRLYDVNKGDILIDGVSIKECTQSSLRNLISFVPQKPFLFSDTIRENIIFGKDIVDEQLLTASKKAHAHEFISLLPDGYDTQISEMGKNLSGGQQQRIAIARALAKKSPILVLDEATSSLDSISENLIKDAIESLSGEISQIIVAHRLSTIEHADRIIYLNQGIIEGIGPLEELLETCAPFKELWEAGSLLSLASS